MAEDLLAKEKEFHRLNKELEEKTRQIMKEVDSVMMGSTNNFYLSPSNQHYSSTMFENINPKILDAPTLMERQSEQSALKKYSSSSNFFEKPHFPKENAEVSNQNAFQSEKNSKTETMIQLLKSKIKSQENEIQAIQTEYKKKVMPCIGATKYCSHLH
ncbi:uncharacterized protein LOC117177230 [Belonocnema kinseyi]|uniref:uncharacterized protein LOC117177230 n=1 Tax=Belonocnema kinseyi TaxID=2817044 RepID=UPI00143D8030|nr:uncharacterized protein LOC117177230 [Belonocnema kinseyi]